MKKIEKLKKSSNKRLREKERGGGERERKRKRERERDYKIISKSKRVKRNGKSV